MEEQKLFPIGQVAKMYHLSVGTLRHYEQEHLLKPAYVNPQTGYRYYGVRQFEQLTSIRYLRMLGLPLEEISAYLQNREIPVITEKLKRQKELIDLKKEELDRIERKIDHRIAQIQDALQSELDQFQCKRLPACRMVWMEDAIRWESYLSLEHSIRRLEARQKTPLTFQGKVGMGISRERLLEGRYDQYDRVFLLLDEEDDYEGTVEELPEGWYAVVRFRGSHGNSPQYYAKMMAYLREQNLSVTGFSREVALIDNSITSDTEQFVTEIAIPVERTK